MSSMTMSASAVSMTTAVPKMTAISIPAAKKMQKLDPFYMSANGSPQSQSPLNRYKSLAASTSPPRENFKNSPQRPMSFGQIDISPKSSPSSSPRTRPGTIDTSFRRLSLDKPVKPSGSSISNPRPQRRLKSILKQQTPAPDSSTPTTPSKSKIHFNTTMEHICLFSKNDFPCEIRDSPRSTIDDSGDVDALTASAGWDAINQPVAKTWSVLSSNHSSMAKMAISDAILLESTRVQGNTLIGGIIVRNYAFHKMVKVRYTIDNWKNSLDLVADYCNSIKNAGSDPYGLDRFTFTINLLDLFADVDMGQPLTICYALQYFVASRTYWDNNNGANYEITIASNASEENNATQDSKQWYETSVPRPRQRSKKSGLKKVVSASNVETKNLGIDKPFYNMSSNFSGSANSRIEDAFSSSIRPVQVPIKVFVPEKKALNTLDVPLGASPNFGFSSFGSSFGTTVPGVNLVDKSAKLYDDDFYMSSPPSSFSRA